MLISFFFGTVFLAYINMHLPDVSTLKDMHMQVPLRVYSQDGQLMAQFGSKRRIPVSLSQIPPLQVKAVLAVEDARYYEHPGVDFIGLLRAGKAVLLSGRKVQGASTITMQVARNFFLTRKKTYMRKIREIMLALKMDRVLTKDKVLELYLNKVYFGNGSYGLAAASQAYYGKSLQDLSIAQMAMLAGLPQAPSSNNPIINPKSALLRRDHVLDRMLEVGFITQQQHDTAVKAPVTASYHRQKITLSAPYVAEWVRRQMVSMYGAATYDSGYKVYTTIDSKKQIAAQKSLENGLIDYSMRHGFRGPMQNWGPYTKDDRALWETKLRSISSSNQLTAAAVVGLQNQSADFITSSGSTVTVPWKGLRWAKKALPQNKLGPMPQQASDILQVGDVVYLRQTSSNEWQLSQKPLVQGALVSMDPTSGAVLSLVGGYDYRLSNFNRVTQAKRQPGSSFKPFIYSAALAKGFTLASIINDAPVVLKDSGENPLWRPNNDTMKFYGPTRLRVGLAESRNLVSIRLLQDISVPYAIGYVSRFGFDASKMPNSLSLALGSLTLSPLALVDGYSVFANGGYKVQPHFISVVKNTSGQVVYKPNAGIVCPSCTQDQASQSGSKKSTLAPSVINSENAYVMTQALKGVITSGTGRAALALKRSDLAGKTGTTNKQIDAWFAGYNARIATVVWVGFDNMKSLHEYGSKAALPIWISYMRAALAGTSLASLPQPDGIVTLRIDPKDGLLARAGQSGSMFEVFRKADAPTQFSSVDESSSLSPDPGLESESSQKNQTDTSDSPLF